MDHAFYICNVAYLGIPQSKRIEKHKMAPKISPKKTWEGFAGGVFFTLILGFFIEQYLSLLSTWIQVIVEVELVIFLNAFFINKNKLTTQ